MRQDSGARGLSGGQQAAGSSLARPHCGPVGGKTLLTPTLTAFAPHHCPLLDQFGTCQFCAWVLR